MKWAILVEILDLQNFFLWFDYNVENRRHLLFEMGIGFSSIGITEGGDGGFLTFAIVVEGCEGLPIIVGAGNIIGLNLLNHNRKYAFFSADDKIGVVDGELFYLFRAKQDNESLYRYRECDTEDLIDRYPERAAAMRRYAFGMTQESQRMLLEGKTACDNNQ